MYQQSQQQNNTRHMPRTSGHYLKVSPPKNMGVFAVTPLNMFQKSNQGSRSKKTSPSYLK